jgi:cell division protein FtsB
MSFDWLRGNVGGVWLVCRVSLIVVVFLYFVFHAIGGTNGLLSYVGIKKQVAEVSERLRDVKEKLESLQLNVSLLGNGTLDIDILEERCRAVLGYSFQDEVIVRTR